MPDLGFIEEVLTSISKEYRGIHISLYEVVSINGSLINYKNKPIFELMGKK